jgi:PASTA domain
MELSGSVSSLGRLTLALVAPATPTAPPTATTVPTPTPTAIPTATPASTQAPTVTRPPTPTLPPGLAVVPDVAGKTEPEAARLLTDSGFRTATARRPGRTVPTDRAIGTDPGVGAVRPVGSTVTILVSSGGG